MDEFEESKKLRQLAKDYSKALISFEVYRAKRSVVIEAYSRYQAVSCMSQALASDDSTLVSEKPVKQEPSLIAGLSLFFAAFVLGAGLGFIVVNFQQFPLECDAVWYACLSPPLSSWIGQLVALVNG